jgi:predicted transcriptional regulator/transcriptional regulator with XRE-family HTH domain
MKKAFIGSRLRQLRRERNLTQAALAEVLGISAAYVNMLEKNQRSLSVPVLMALSEQFGIDWHDVVPDSGSTVLADLRTAIRDPLFADNAPDLDELRAAIDHTPVFVQSFLKLYQNHRTAIDNVMRLGGERLPADMLALSSETTIHDFFRSQGNHFDSLERAAENLAEEQPCPSDEMQMMLKARLRDRHDISVVTLPVEEMKESLRIYDAEAASLQLSEALDFPNRTFQMAHVLCFVEFADILADITSNSSLKTKRSIDRCHIELANYFAAALLMPYDRFLDVAEQTRYDINRLVSAFSVSYEQVCQRLTTLHRDTRRGVPFFFLRVDRAGNVTKRFNATSFTIAEHGGSCPVWNLHTTFRTPGVIQPQFVELPDGERYFTLSRTTDRPVYSMDTQERRLAISLGCEIRHAQKLIYTTRTPIPADEDFSKIGISCHLCSRVNCAQRAHDPLVIELKTDPSRRGETRYES